MAAPQFHTFVDGFCTVCGADLDWEVEGRHVLWGETDQCEGQRAFQLTVDLYI